MSLKVLLVDDDEMIIYLHTMVAQISGLSSAPICFADGKAAIDYLNEHYKAGDSFLILLDINMPVMDGWGFLNAIQTQPYSGTTTVVMVTSSIDSMDREKAYQYKNVIDYIEKPLNPEIFKRIMHLPQVVPFL